MNHKNMSGTTATAEVRFTGRMKRPEVKAVTCKHHGDDLIAKLKLSAYYPSKLTIPDVICLQVEGSNTKAQEQIHHLPWLMLRRIMSIDSRWRDKLIPDIQMEMEERTKGLNLRPETRDMRILSASNFLAPKIFQSQSNPVQKAPEMLHPLDIFITTLLCCGDELKQVLYQRLLMCKQAVPLIYRLQSMQKPCFSLLPFRSINMEYRTSDTALSICAATNSANIVGFLRVKSTILSKSKLLNDIISDETHAAFCYRDKLPEKTSKMVNTGLIETMCYLPAGRKKDAFEKVLTFLNLRGDAACLPEEVSIMASMTCAVVVVVDCAFLADEHTAIVMRCLYAEPTEIILLLTCSPEATDTDDVSKVLSALLEKIKTNPNKDITLLFSFNMETKMLITSATLRDDVRSAIKTTTKDQGGKSLRFCAKELSRKSLVSLDEDTGDCKEGKSTANEIYLKLCGSDIKKHGGVTRENYTVKPKTEIFELQGAPWRKWSILKKKKYRTRGSQSDIESIKMRMKELRIEQSGKMKELPLAVAKFINSVFLDDKGNKNIPSFIMWLKIFLNENSRKVLPDLRREVHKAWIAIRQTNDNAGENADLQILQQAVTTAERELAEASFGFEHFIRELGQIYECWASTKPASSVPHIENLPYVVAKLLLKGQAIEILDGDAANVPMVWVKAVLESVQEIVGDKKLFLLSVLGIQSSGKSTLLNAMFGLQFAVSAGRCTRGVFVQLVPAHDSLPYDYVMIIDTEGLRAPELRQQHLDHDNELATFVIGLADITIVNIKGENMAELRDVLQITVHAFLRMKLAKNKMELKRKCIFVHQNVAALLAPQQMMQGLKHLQETLDEMTECAAEEENISDIRRFNQVIDFHCDKHVWYFPDLWSSDPPMASCNTGYSDKVTEVKVSLAKMVSEWKAFTTVSGLVQRIKDLWDGILTDNFVFSFRNSLEIKAYNQMDTVYHKETGKFEKAIMLWFEKEACIAIELCENVGGLDPCFDNLSSKLRKRMNEKEMETCKSLNNYFENNDMHETVIQWKDRRMLRLKEMSVSLDRNIKQEILNKIDEQKLAILSRNRDKQHEKEIVRKARELAEELRGKNPTEEELEGSFDEMWKSWIVALERRVPLDTEPLSLKIERCLYDRFEKDHSLLGKCLELTSEKTPGVLKPMQLQKLEGSIDITKIDSSFLSRKSFLGKAQGALDHKEKAEKSQAVLYTDTVLRRAHLYLESLMNKDIKFQDQHAKSLVNEVTEAVEEENKKDHAFKFIWPYVIYVVVHVCRYAVTKFEEMNERYETKHGQTAKLQSYKDTVKHIFINTVKQECSEVVAADVFCDFLRTKIVETVRRSLPRKIHEFVVCHFSRKKYHVILNILDDLAREENFILYTEYIHDSYAYVFRWIKTFINDSMFVSSNEKGSRYLELVYEILDPIFARVTTGIAFATSRASTFDCNKISHWADIFQEHVRSELAVPSDLWQSSAAEHVVNIEHFKTRLNDKLHELKEDIASIFKKDKPGEFFWSGTSPYAIVMETLWGCPEQCPFCQEPCQHNEDHIRDISHSCIQHRLMGVCGSYNKASRKLITYNCNFAVQLQNCKVSCRGCHLKCLQSGKKHSSSVDEDFHVISQYKTYIPDWDIYPHPDCSSYWKWFMCTFREKLTNFYRKKAPDIPSSWKDISKDDAIASLRNIKG